MALANIIKEVDPPVELTQAEYDALSTAQKNDGTVYFITDGNGAFPTAATVPAEDTSGGTSNVQDELQKKVEKADVVNNFTTTQEGYAADARALKTIADNYSLKTDLPSSNGNYAFLGGISGAELNGTNRTNFSLNISINKYRLIRLNTSYYKAGLPDYGGATVSVQELKQAINEPIYVADTRSGTGYSYAVRYVNETTLSAASTNATASTQCLSVHGLLD